MLEEFKENWHYFKEAPPGERFKQHFKRRQRSQRSIFQRMLFIGSGTLIVIVGIFLLPAPGPGTVVLLIGAGLIAQESLLAARTLDWAELRLRKLASWGIAAWHRSSLGAKILLVLLAIALAGATGFGTYKLLFAK